MAILNIRTDEDPILRKKSRRVEKFDDSLKSFIDDMYETMYDAQGVGLAAVQVGRLRRMVVIDDYNGNKLTLINPLIESCGADQVEGIEGCLSVPDRMGKIERAKKVQVSYQDTEGKEKKIEAEDFLARIIQHELDHLDGILYTDKASELFNTEDLEQGEDK